MKMRVSIVRAFVLGMLPLVLAAAAGPLRAEAAVTVSSGSGARPSVLDSGIGALRSPSPLFMTPEPAAGGSAQVRRKGTSAKAIEARSGYSRRAANLDDSDEIAVARQVLAGYVAKYPLLAGATVEFGDARGYQAISYYQSARIIIDSDHSASVERIIAHEIWHIIDWRDNGRIDWGENVPPR